MALPVVTIFSRHGCVYCELAKQVLDDGPNMTVRLVYLDEQEDYDTARAELMRLAEYPEKLTVPQIFIGGTLISGGATRLQELSRLGELGPLLERYGHAPPLPLPEPLRKMRVYTPALEARDGGVVDF